MAFGTCEGSREEYVRIEILCIGDELLDGRVQDQNAAWFGARLAREGLRLAASCFVADDINEIIAFLERASKRSDFLLVSGGLGPTDDDITREAFAEWLSAPLVEDGRALEDLRTRYELLRRPVAETNHKQALFPEGAEVLHTEVGTAAGFRLVANGCTVDVVPGVPKELRWFVETHTLPPMLGNSVGAKRTRRWQLFGLGESEVAARLEGLDLLSCHLHYEARFPEVHLFARTTEAAAATAIEDLEVAILERIGQHLIAVDDESLVSRLAKRLIDRRWSVATAESCTGGQIARRLTSISGATAYFREGFVTYANEAKAARLGVHEGTLETYGAVSEETCIEMAIGAKERSGADVTIAVTGIAGPTGGTAEKPVGTVFLAMAFPDSGIVGRLQLGHRDRDAIQTLTTWSALAILLWYLEDRMPEGIVRPF